MSFEELIIKKWAKLKGISEEEARKILGPLLGDKDKMKEILDLLQLVDAIDTEPGTLTHDIKDTLKAKALIQLAAHTTQKKDELEELVERAIKAKQVLNLVDKILSSESREDPRIVMLEKKFEMLQESIMNLAQALKEAQENKFTKQIVDTLQRLNESIQAQIQEINKRIEKLEREGFDLEKIKQKLEKIGWKVVSPAEIQMLDVEKAKEMLAKLGYKVEPGYISADQLNRILEEERQRVMQQIKKELEKEVEKDRIEATKEAVVKSFEILGTTIKELFKPIVQKQMSQIAHEIESNMTEEDIEEALKDLDSYRESKNIEPAPKNPKISNPANPKPKKIKKVEPEEEEDVILF